MSTEDRLSVNMDVIGLFRYSSCLISECHSAPTCGFSRRATFSHALQVFSAPGVVALLVHVRKKAGPIRDITPYSMIFVRVRVRAERECAEIGGRGAEGRFPASPELAQDRVYSRDSSAGVINFASLGLNTRQRCRGPKRGRCERKYHAQWQGFEGGCRRETPCRHP